MGVLLKLLTVFALGAAELFVAIPTGLALKLHPVAVGFAAALGGLLGVSVIVLVGSRLRARLTRRFGGSTDKGRHGRVRRIWERYGIVGLGLLVPIIVGPALGAALGLVLGAPSVRLLLWMSLGVILWSATLTLAASLGLALFHLF